MSLKKFRNIILVFSLGLCLASLAPVYSQSPVASPQSVALASDGVFNLPPLPYAYDALEPYIDRQTMTLHHDRHHAGYVKNLNEAIAQHPELAETPLDELLLDIEKIPADIQATVRNNGGGHANHSLYWSMMTPNSDGVPSGELAAAIIRTFGDFDTFKVEFNNAAKKRFGSGWGWLVMNQEQQLEVISMANQDNPLMVGKFPIMGNDVWEHAYYLKYQNKRGDYLDAWWNLVNWQKANQRYLAGTEFFP